jgi:hypothetical protein
MRDLYPGIMEFIERNLPTYPTHAARRIEEMREALGWFAELGQSASMTQAAIVVLERISNGGLKPSERNFKHLLQNIVALDPLAKDAREVSNSQRDA